MIARSTVVFIRQQLADGKINIYIQEKKDQLAKERYENGGCEQIPTQSELKVAEEIRDGTFTEEEII